MHIYLKIKIKSLTSEAQDIRKAERQFHTTSHQRLQMKRTLKLGTFHSEGNPTGRTSTLNEAQIIRLQKKLDRATNQLNNPKDQKRFLGLRTHRTDDLRKEARSSFLAYGFLRNKDYKQIELTNKKVDWDQVERLVKKYSEDDPRVTLQKFAEWVGASGKATKAYALHNGNTSI